MSVNLYMNIGPPFYFILFTFIFKYDVLVPERFAFEKNSELSSSVTVLQIVI